ncbi:THUMP domain-containing protein 1 [Engraulis encrasicolus]|uniref:THUMP domain-containing protein 1 n=1 Tax=Engraulis encrasicolus TaxID=184585 RepID=UPI002FD6DDEC
MSDAAAESKKRGRKHYGGMRGKRLKVSRELEVGMRGILITCNMNERKCTAEAYNLLNEYAEKLYGPEKFGDKDKGGSDEGDDASSDEDDMEAALKKEVSQMKESTEKGKRRFQAMESGANNVVFIRTEKLEPDELVHHILQDLHSTKKKKSRTILRMLPVSGTCKAFPEDMERYLTGYLEPWFKEPAQATYQIAFKARNSSHNKRDDVIKALAVLVGKLNPKNKVDLTNPELTIIVEVIKSVCCVSVVRDYVLFRKFNLQEVAKTDGPPKNDPSGPNQGGVKGDPETKASGQTAETKAEAGQQQTTEAEEKWKGNDKTDQKGAADSTSEATGNGST